MEFSVSKMKETLRSESDKRVSEQAAKELGSIMEMFAGDVAEEAAAVAAEDDRKTVRGEDIKEALR